MSTESHVSPKERRQFFVSHVTTSHKSIDLSDYESSESGINTSEPIPTPQKGDAEQSVSSAGSSPAIITESIGPVSQSPFFSQHFDQSPKSPSTQRFGTRLRSKSPAHSTPVCRPASPALNPVPVAAIAVPFAVRHESPPPAPTPPSTPLILPASLPGRPPLPPVPLPSFALAKESGPLSPPPPPPPETSPPPLEIVKTVVNYLPQHIDIESIRSPVRSIERIDYETILSPSLEERPIVIPSSPVSPAVASSVMPTDQTPENPTVLVNGSTATNSNGITDDLVDPWCDPEKPRVVQFQDISAAAFKIKSGIMMTPCTRSHLSNMTDVQLFFKKDFLQYTGSFKERGARYTLLMLPEVQQKQGVIAASAGNHALALSYHGQELGIPVTVVMPLVAPIMKVQSCRQFGANVIIHGKDIGESREYAMRLAKDRNLTYINGYDHPHIIAGQGTMGLEIVEQVKNIDAVVVPVGGGGLIAGVALAVKSLYPHIQVIGVESERCASFSEALKHGKPIYTKADSTLADGLAVPKVGGNALATGAPLIDKCVVVKEEYIAMAILRLVEIEKAVVEGAGACGLAAILAGLLPELKGKRVVIPLCGGNIDTTVLGRCLERGLAVDGRLVKFSVTVSDRPGGIAELCRLMANLGVSIKDILHERAWLKSDIFSVEVRVMCETRDYEHAVELERMLKEHYSNVHFGNMADIMSSDGLKADKLLTDTRSPLL